MSRAQCIVGEGAADITLKQNTKHISCYNCWMGCPSIQDQKICFGFYTFVCIYLLFCLGDSCRRIIFLLTYSSHQSANTTVQFWSNCFLNDTHVIYITYNCLLTFFGWYLMYMGSGVRKQDKKHLFQIPSFRNSLLVDKRNARKDCFATGFHPLFWFLFVVSCFSCFEFQNKYSLLPF